jgi:outer membrane lipoprotein SlyB
MMHSFLALMLTAWLLAGCTSTPGDDDADARRAPQQQSEQKEYPGVVESVREIEMESERSGVAPAAGAVVGGTVGEAAAQSGTRPGLEITVRLDAGRVIAVTQPAGKESFKPGERVRVVSDGRTARVTH